MQPLSENEKAGVRMAVTQALVFASKETERLYATSMDFHTAVDALGAAAPHLVEALATSAGASEISRRLLAAEMERSTGPFFHPDRNGDTT